MPRVEPEPTSELPPPELKPVPLLYPPAFGNGIPGYRQVTAYPYGIIYETVKRAAHRLEPLGCRVCAWIQDIFRVCFQRLGLWVGGETSPD